MSRVARVLSYSGASLNDTSSREEGRTAPKCPLMSRSESRNVRRLIEVSGLGSGVAMRGVCITDEVIEGRDVGLAGGGERANGVDERE